MYLVSTDTSDNCHSDQDQDSQLLVIWVYFSVGTVETCHGLRY